MKLIIYNFQTKKSFHTACIILHLQCLFEWSNAPTLARSRCMGATPRSSGCTPKRRQLGWGRAGRDGRSASGAEPWTCWSTTRDAVPSVAVSVPPQGRYWEGTSFLHRHSRHFNTKNLLWLGWDVQYVHTNVHLQKSEKYWWVYSWWLSPDRV